jgi:hypothetical protein
LAALAFSSAGAQAAEAAPSASKKEDSARNFYLVLEDLLSDFEQDLKSGQVQGLRDMAIRSVTVNELVPPSFKNHLELVLSERLMKTSKVRMLQCFECRSKKTVVSGDKMVVSGPETNAQELSRIARKVGIQNFMDAVFSYQPTGMVLSLSIHDADSGAMAWSSSYNSETSKTAAYRRGVAKPENEGVRNASEYLPVVQYRAILGYGMQRNIAKSTGTLSAGLRMMERYDNRKKEVGFELTYARNASSIVGALTDTDSDLYAGVNLTLLFLHAWNLIGEEENLNHARGGVVVGLGGTYASGFLGGLVRAGYEWRLAKHWAVGLNLGYRPSATKFVGTQSSGTVSGVDYGLGISALF